jgi:high-affinity nickel-transport protein
VTLGLLVTAFTLGLRHGIDWDHIAAITDIAGLQPDRRRAVRTATIYALGHGAVVLVLGSVAILLGDVLPPSVDAAMERVVGITLLVLGASMVYGIARDRRRFRMRSRWLVLASLARSVAGRHQRREVVVEHEHDHDHDHLHEHEHSHEHPDAERSSAVRVRHRHRHIHRAPAPVDPFTGYGDRAAFVIGLLHGVGAETASQVVLFLGAAEVGGGGPGELVLVVFLLGLLLSNTAVAVTAAAGFLDAERHGIVYLTVAVVAAACSTALGVLYLFGGGSRLPEILT